MFDHFEVQFPAIMPRNFAVILDTVVSRKIKQLGLEDQQLFETVLDWKKAFVLNNAVLDFQFEKEKESLSDIFEHTGKKASELEKSLGNAFEAGKVRAMKIMDQLAKKVRKAEERRQAVQIRRREEIQELLFPGGSPQERVENFMRFYLESPGFVDELFELFDPFDFNYMILRPDNG
jgi:bacillithiol synthase